MDEYDMIAHCGSIHLKDQIMLLTKFPLLYLSFAMNECAIN